MMDDQAALMDFLGSKQVDEETLHKIRTDKVRSCYNVKFRSQIPKSGLTLEFNIKHDRSITWSRPSGRAYI
jgi:hypothetical protein